MIALEVRDLTKRFSNMERPALDKVSFQVEQGKCLGIVGGSGCGKSTLARSAMMLEQPDSGHVLLFGDEIGGRDLKSSRDVYRTMQMIFQNPIDSFDPRRTLGFSLMEPGRSFGLSRAEAERKARELLVAVGLDESFFERYPSQVSGGQCQRAAIARALMTDPSVLICDEITSALDVTTQARIVELISRIKKKVTIVFITHDLALASIICDNLVVMEKGRIVECGAAHDVLENPQSDYTKLLLSSVYTLNG